MSYAKASDLLGFALELASRHDGMTYSEVDDLSDAPSPTARRRNTQRMIVALERVFGFDVQTGRGEDGQMRVRLGIHRLKELVGLLPQELSALDHAIEALASANAVSEAQALQELRTKIRLLTPRKDMLRLEPDYEALLGASHLAVRPGPQPRIEPTVMRPLTEAILSLRQVSFEYERDGSVKHRVVHPLGVIFGHRAYLVAGMEGRPEPSRWRLDRMRNVAVVEGPAVRPADFDLAALAKRAFGSFHVEAEHGPVEWRFAPEIAENVRSFRFHPDQEMTEEPDGSVTVRFEASGHLEMAWALYPWGDAVTVIKPDALRQLVDGHQRRDFPALP
jgi:predicted DNA-binding transcriptional regulator YafY